MLRGVREWGTRCRFNRNGLQTIVSVNQGVKGSRIPVQAPINPSDLNTVEGKYPIKSSLPAVGGHEGVGEVLAIGGKVLPTWESQTEYCCWMQFRVLFMGLAKSDNCS